MNKLVLASLATICFISTVGCGNKSNGSPNTDYLNAINQDAITIHDDENQITNYLSEVAAMQDSTGAMSDKLNSVISSLQTVSSKIKNYQPTDQSLIDNQSKIETDLSAWIADIQNFQFASASSSASLITTSGQSLTNDQSSLDNDVLDSMKLMPKYNIQPSFGMS